VKYPSISDLFLGFHLLPRLRIAWSDTSTLQYFLMAWCLSNGYIFMARIYDNKTDRLVQGFKCSL